MKESEKDEIFEILNALTELVKDLAFSVEINRQEIQKLIEVEIRKQEAIKQARKILEEGEKDEQSK